MEFRLGIWEVAVLALLREAPMHPYQMQGLLRLRHKDDILVLKRGSLYHAIGRLMRASLIAVQTRDREGKRPERTIYRITPAGLDALVNTLRRIVASPRRESSEFMAAMSFLVHLEPEEAVRNLKERAQRLEAEVRQYTAGLAAASSHVLRINLVESEYLLAMLKAELRWVQQIEKEIQQGKLTWNLASIFRGAQAERDTAGQRKGRR